MEETLINEAQAAIEQEGDIEKVKSVLSKITKAYSKNTKRLDKIIHLSDRQQDTLQKLNEQAKNEQEMAHRKQKAMIANDFEDDENFDIKIVLIRHRMQPVESKQGQGQKLQSYFRKTEWMSENLSRDTRCTR